VPATYNNTAAATEKCDFSLGSKRWLLCKLLSALEENFFAQQLASVTNSMVPNLIPKPSCKASQYKKKQL